jgi:serine/threonine-protein kinase
MNLPSGHILQNGKYRLLQVVGQGGFGITYKGILTEVKGQLGTISSEVPICIKEYFFKEYCHRNPANYNIEVHSPVGRQMFHKFKEKLIEEARILSEVRHPNIVNVLDVFEENNTAYIAMEYIGGHSLRYIVEKEGILPEDRARRYIMQICDALRFIHNKNILHLDIKPSNILVDSRDSIRLIDFGVSKQYKTATEKETSTTMLILSKGFASIEQYDNEGTSIFSPCPDIYSLGATIYNILTGKIPTESILRATRPFPDPKALNPAISDNMEKVILKAMQVKPADRYQSVTEMMNDLNPTGAGSNAKEPEETSDSDITLLYNPKPLPPIADEEQTIATSNSSSVIIRKRSKARRNFLFASIIALLVITGASLFLLMGKSPDTVANPQPTLAVDTLTADTPTAGSSTPDSISSTRENPGIITLPPLRQPDSADTNTIATIPSDTAPDHEPGEADFQILLASGKEKMERGDYSEAREDLYNAYKINPTDEVFTLISTCDTKYKEKQISERRNMYELKMPFGKLTIVRKKSSGKYGAIDEEGEERIICKYRTSEAYRDGLRIFVRDDNLSDIYDSTGRMTSTNVTSY